MRGRMTHRGELCRTEGPDVYGEECRGDAAVKPASRHRADVRHSGHRRNHSCRCGECQRRCRCGRSLDLVSAQRSYAEGGCTDGQRCGCTSAPVPETRAKEHVEGACYCHGQWAGCRPLELQVIRPHAGNQRDLDCEGAATTGGENDAHAGGGEPGSEAEGEGWCDTA